MPNLTIRLSDEDMGILDRLSTQWGLTRSDTIRRLIRSFDRAVGEVREESCRVCGRLGVAYLFESMLLNPEVIYNLINANRDIVGDRDFIIGWVVTSDHRVFFSTMDDLGRWLLRQAKEYVRRYYAEREGGDVGMGLTTEKPKVQAKPPAPKPPAGGPCHKVVVVYPNGEARDVAEELYRGCRGEEVVEITPEEYERYLRNEASLDELIEKHRRAGGAQTAAGGGAANTQAQPQPSTQQAAQAGVSAHTQTQPSNPQLPQTNKQVDLRNLPYLTLGEVAVRLGLLKLPNNNNRDRGAGGGA
jgi:hypothetical protein